MFHLLSPAFLLCCGLVAIPVLMHLIHRRANRKVYFSAFRFLHQAECRTRSFRRITDWLLLLLRAGVFLLLAFLFARPVMSGVFGLRSSGRTLFLLLDCTASTRTVLPGGTLFSSLQKQALTLLEDCQPHDKVALVRLGYPVTDEIFPPTTDLEQVKKIIRESRPLATGGSAGTVLERWAAASPLVFSDAEIHCFTDGLEPLSQHQFSFSDAVVSLLEKRHAWMIWHVPQYAQWDNHSILKMVPQPSHAQNDSPTECMLELSGSGQVPLSFASAGNEEEGAAFHTQNIHTGAGCSVSVEFPWQDAGFAGFAQLALDSYSLDDRFYFSLPPMIPAPVALVYGQGPQELQNLQMALSIGDFLKPELLSWDEFQGDSMGKYAMVFLVNPPDLNSKLPLLRKLLLRKKTVVLFPGSRQGIRADVIGDLLAENPEKRFPLAISPQQLSKMESAPLYLASGRGVTLLQRLRRAYPDPWGISLKEYLNLRCDSGMSALVELSNFGDFCLKADTLPLYLFAVTADRSWSDWPLTPSYCLLLQEISREALGTEQRVSSMEVGESLPLSWRGPELNLTVERRNNGGWVQESLRRDKMEEDFLLAAVDEPGIVTVRGMPDGRLRYLPVNVPDSERGILPVPEKLLKQRAGEARSVVLHSVEEEKAWRLRQVHGFSLTPVLALLLLLVMCAEAWLANLRSPKEGRRKS